MSTMIAGAQSQALTATPRAIINAYSTSGYNPQGISQNVGKLIAIGALTAGVLLPVLSITGSGCLESLYAVTQNATARTMRMQLVLDGVTVFDSTSAAISNTGQGGQVVGFIGNSIYVALARIPFKSSCVFSVASSLTESNAFNVLVQYTTN